MHPWQHTTEKGNKVTAGPGAPPLSMLEASQGNSFEAWQTPRKHSGTEGPKHLIPEIEVMVLLLDLRIALLNEYSTAMTLIIYHCIPLYTITCLMIEARLFGHAWATAPRTSTKSFGKRRHHQHKFKSIYHLSWSSVVDGMYWEFGIMKTNTK